MSQYRAIYLLFLGLAVAGSLAYRNMPSSVYPELSFPRIAIIAEGGDLAPERMVLEVTQPLEEAAAQVYGLRWLRTKTLRGAAELQLEFEPGVDMQQALQQLQARLGEVRSSLPPDLTLVVERMTPAIFPVLTYTLSSDTRTQADLFLFSRYQLAPELSRLPGVARVVVEGGDVPELSVQVAPQHLTALGLDLEGISRELAATNQIQLLDLTVVGDNQPPDLNSVLVATRGSIPVRLDQVARVGWGRADLTRVITSRSQRVVAVSIFRQPNSNVVDVTRKVDRTMAGIRLPAGVQVEKAYAVARLVQDSLGSVREAILVGIGLIMVVLYWWLRDTASMLIAGVSIPLSALASAGVLWLFGQSLNLMSLGGLAVAIGLVIDDAIVVLENLHRQLELGLDPKRAVRQTLAELTGPVVSSTLTTVVVFLPLGLLSGVVGQFFTSFTIALASAVLASLVLSLTLTPILAARFLRVHHTPSHQLERAYARLLQRILPYRSVALVLLGCMALAAVWLGTRLGSDFLPVVNEGSYLIDFHAPPGTTLLETDRMAAEIERMLAQESEVQSWVRRTGSENGLFATHPNVGDVVVQLKPGADVFTMIERQRSELAARLPQLEVEFHQLLHDQLNDLSGTTAPIEVRLSSEDPVLLRQWSARVAAEMEHVKGLVDVVDPGVEVSPQLHVKVDQARAARLGLTVEQVQAQARDALLGKVATRIGSRDHLVNVRVRLEPTSPENVPIVGAGGAWLPLGQLAVLEPAAAEPEITRENQRRYLVVGASVEGRDLGSAVHELRGRLDRLNYPAELSVSLGGLLENQQRAFAELAEILLLAAGLVYFVMVVQLRSFRAPMAILGVLPAGFLGVTVALWLTGTTLSVSALMGVILLVGLVVKNGIILGERARNLRSTDEFGTEAEALAQAGAQRLRPILMTTLCTLLGLLPLALGWGSGSELQRPLAIAVIGGLGLATLFTLLCLPILLGGSRR